MYSAKAYGLLLISFTCWCMIADDALADDCSSIIPGAQMGPSPNFNQWPWANACYISWPGTDSRDYTRNPRLEYERQCKATPGYLHFEGDFGSNRNTCIFSAPSATPSTGGGDPAREAAREHDLALDREYRRRYQELLAKLAVIYPSYNVNMMGHLAELEAENTYKATSLLSVYGLDSLHELANEEFCLAERLHNLDRVEQDDSTIYCHDIPVSQILAKTNHITDLWAKEKRSAPGKNFVSITFARGNSSYYAASGKHETLQDAVSESVGNCELMRENTSPDMAEDRRRHPCEVNFWTYNGCVMSATTPDDKSIVTASMNQGSPQADQENALASCRAVSQSPLCQAGPHVCAPR